MENEGIGARELFGGLTRSENRHRAFQVAERADHQEGPLIEELVPPRLVGREMEGCFVANIHSGLVLQNVFGHGERLATSLHVAGLTKRP
jgi:hypothetical protein